MIQSRSLCYPFYPSDPDTPQLYLHEATSAGGTRGSRNLKVALLSQHLCAAPCRELGCGVLTALQCAGNAYWSPLGLCELWASAASWHRFIRHRLCGILGVYQKFQSADENVWIVAVLIRLPRNSVRNTHLIMSFSFLIRGHYVNAKPLLDFLRCS